MVFLSTKIDARVIAEGWREWAPGETNKLSTSYYAEYRSFGIGANPSGREPHSHQLKDGEAARWSLRVFFAGVTDWLPTNHQVRTKSNVHGEGVPRRSSDE
ncbi:pectinesterase family protein [Bradyrhizobium japonicum]|uniref:pectinesterase family protein n=1 Tax=Bradyrhizobium japonicum TaxID=375 RepID=UPI00384A6563